MRFDLAPLPYATDALEPHLGAETLEIHYGKHHRGYLEKLRKAIQGTPEAERSLEELIRISSGDVFNNAAQIWNHDFYWQSLRPDGGGEPRGELLAGIEAAFGSFSDFRKAFAEAAIGEFGSGWAWLVQDGAGRLQVRNSSDADNPLRLEMTPLLTLDVWEHAYYLDYRNERARYVDVFLERLINWDFAAANLERALSSGSSSDNQGEGNREADRRYRESATDFARSERADSAARSARQRNGD
jgi:Fe-Mn family superoxide dismutase